MKISAPHYIIGPLMHELFDASVGAVLMERTGTGWMVEFMTPVGSTVVGNITRMGGVVMPPKEAP